VMDACIYIMNKMGSTWFHLEWDWWVHESEYKAICTYTYDEKDPATIIASPNPVDADSGYVMTTPELRALLNILSQNIFRMCPWSSCGSSPDSEKGPDPKKSCWSKSAKLLHTDIEARFNLIHADTQSGGWHFTVSWRTETDFAVNPNIRFEFGTEENGWVLVWSNIKKMSYLLKTCPTLNLL
jgi:hypothetical protein